MFCVSCGAELGADFAFCQSCGRPQKNSKYISQELPPPSQSSTSSSARTLENTDPASAPKPMRFIESIKYSLKNYANFKGRASRSEFWFWVLFNALVPFCSVFLIVLFSGVPYDSLSSQDSWDGLYGLFVLTLIIPNLARVVRRLHDTNKSGKYLFFALIPLVGNIFLIILFCTKGDVGPNRFGPGDFSKGNQSQNEVRQEPTITPSAVASGERTNKFKVAFNSFLRNKKLVIATVLTVLFLGTLQAHLQYGKLIGSIEISEVQMEEYNEMLMKVWEEHSSGSPRRFTSDASRAEWESDIKYESGVYQSRIANAGYSVKDVLLLVWNMEHKDVSSKYLIHNSVWQKHLAQRKADPYSNRYNDLIDSTWLNFCREIKSGIPWYAFGRFDSRISKICISDNDSGNTN